MNAIYLWRIIYTFMIMVYHFDTHFFVRSIACKGGVFGWYIAVDFFFIVSGFLLFKKAEKSKGTLSALGYTIERIKKIYPPYILAFIVTFIVIMAVSDTALEYWKADGIVNAFLEASLLQGVFICKGPFVNYTAWYISVLIIAGFFIYMILSKYKKVFLFILAPVNILLGFLYLYKFYGSLDVTIATEGWTILTPAMIRGLAGMSLGVYAAILSKKLQEFLNDKKAFVRVLIKALGIGILTFVPIASLRYGETPYDFLYVIFLFLGVTIAFVPFKNEPKPGFKKFIVYSSGLTLNMYLIHNVFREWIFTSIYPKTELLSDKDKIFIMILYFASVIVASVCMDLLLKGIKKLFSKKGETK